MALLRALRFVNKDPIHYRLPACPASPFNSSTINRRNFGAPALQLNDSETQKNQKSKKKSSNSWEASSSVYFGSQKTKENASGGRTEEGTFPRKESSYVKTRNVVNEHSGGGSNGQSWKGKHFTDSGKSNDRDKSMPRFNNAQGSDNNRGKSSNGRDNNRLSFREQFSGHGNVSDDATVQNRSSGDVRDFSKKDVGNSKDFSKRNAGHTRDFSKRDAGNFKDFSKKDAGSIKDFSKRKSGDTRDFSKRNGGDGRDFTKRNSGDGRDFSNRNSRDKQFPPKHFIKADDDDDEEISTDALKLENEPSDLDDEEYDSEEDFPQAGDVIKYDWKKGAGHVETDNESSGAQEDDNNEQDNEEEVEDRSDLKSSNKDLSPMLPKLNGRMNHNANRESSSSSSSLPKLKGEVVYGVGPVYAALKVSRREFYCLYVQENMPIHNGSASRKKDKKAFEWIVRSAIESGLEVKEIPKHDLNMLAENRPHQGLVLDASPLELVNAYELDPPLEENSKAPVWVALDEVQDPQNFGAILRSAYFMGASGAVICAKNSAPLSAVVSKASAGALEVMELRSCKNMMKFLDISAKNGWQVVGAVAAGSDAISVKDMPRGLPTILVLGGEAKGLRTNVKMSCNLLVSIPGIASDSHSKAVLPGNLDHDGDSVLETADDVTATSHSKQAARKEFVAVDSLNVSVAAGILLHELLNSPATVETHVDA